MEWCGGNPKEELVQSKNQDRFINDLARELHAVEFGPLPDATVQIERSPLTAFPYTWTCMDDLAKRFVAG